MENISELEVAPAFTGIFFFFRLTVTWGTNTKALQSHDTLIYNYLFQFTKLHTHAHTGALRHTEWAYVHCRAQVNTSCTNDLLSWHYWLVFFFLLLVVFTAHISKYTPGCTCLSTRFHRGMCNSYTGLYAHFTVKPQMASRFFYSFPSINSETPFTLR